jgi:hypothetical protein
MGLSQAQTPRLFNGPSALGHTPYLFFLNFILKIRFLLGFLLFFYFIIQHLIDFELIFIFYYHIIK